MRADAPQAPVGLLVCRAPGNSATGLSALPCSRGGKVARGAGRDADRWTIASAKFLQPVSPGTALTLVHEASPNGGVRFEVRGPGGVVASGTLSPKD